MTKQIIFALAALALGAAIMSVPALAQKAANDGGMIGEPSGSAARQSSQQSTAPTAGRRLYNSVPGAAPAQPAPAQSPGKPANDGGPM